MIRFHKRGNLGSRCIGHYKITSWVGKVVYRMELPDELRLIHNRFHVSQLQKCLVDENGVVPLELFRLIRDSTT